jgi:hypothetical protein
MQLDCRQDIMDRASETPPWEELYRYWLDRHAAGKPPTRAAIDPMIDLRHLASNLIIIGVHPGGAEYRLVGSQVVSHFGVDHTGKHVGTSTVDPVQLKAWQATVGFVSHQHKPKLLVSYYPRAEKSKTIAMLLPLTPETDGVMKLLGATFFGWPFPDTGAYPELAVETVELGL